MKSEASRAAWPGLLRWLPYGPAFLILALAAAWILLRDAAPAASAWRDTWLPAAALCLALLATLAAGRGMAARETDRRQAKAAEALAAQVQAQALQSQLHPHALFNALSGLTELVHEDPEAAEAALVALSDFLRRLLRQGASASAPLREERALLDLQLRIAELRLGPRLQVQWEWPDWADDQEAPPLLLQPLVENAIRHGIAARTMGGRLRVRIAREDAALLLEVANTGEYLEPAREGTGLGNLRERLALLDPPGALDLRQRGAWTVARVLLPEAR